MTPTPAAPCDLLVIGGGTAGLVAAKTAAGFGADVLLVERDRPGGDCLWTGCVPSKALLASAAAAASARRASALGVHVTDVTVDFAAVMAHVHGAIAQIAPVDSFEALQAAGVRVLTGKVTLTGHNAATIDGQPLTFRQALLATGSRPTLPPIPGLRDVRPLTSDTVWDLTQLPARLLILGGGSIGCELGQAFARLGAAVVLIESQQQLLPSEDQEVAAVVQRSLERDGVDIRLTTTVVEVRPTGGCPAVAILDDGSTVDFDAVLVCAGRTPRTQGLGLSAAGVEVDARGHVTVDAHLRTTNPRIWAAGDLTGHPPFTHTAGVHGSVAASNAILGLPRAAPLLIPRVTYTSPEVAAVGLSPKDANSVRGAGVLTWGNAHVDRAVTEAHTEGFTKLVVDRRRRIIGGVIVGPRAGETLGELTLAIDQKRTTSGLAGVVHAYPTWNDGVWNAAISQVRTSLEGPLLRPATRGLTRLRRRWLIHQDRAEP